ncbi:MAG: ABC transporter permease [Bdellovibrionales bacterium]|nr:ABC transporter permease [Bdellovibrionales bacterium]
MRSWILILFHRLGVTVSAPMTEHLDAVGEMRFLSGCVWRCCFARPWRWREIIHAGAQIGVSSLPIITLATTFAGLVVTNEIAWHMDTALNNTAMIPGFTARFIMRELGIAIPALLVVAKVGAAMTAEVATMKITEQIDALKLLRIDPVAYLVFPRWIASILSLICLTLFAIAVTLFFAVTVAVSKYGFNVDEYLNNLRHFVGKDDVIYAVVKAGVFGSVIPIISCAYGFRCKGGAEGVGLATTNAVVASTLAVIGLDFVITYVFSIIMG